MPIETLARVAGELAAGGTVDVGWEPDASGGRPGARAVKRPGATAPLRDEMAELEGTFIEASAQSDTRAAIGALLALDSTISARIRAGEDGPDLDNASTTFRALIARLGESAEVGTRDPRPILEPFVTTLLELRARARSSRDWDTADLIRDRLAAAGVEVRDEAASSTWVLPGPAPR